MKWCANICSYLLKPRCLNCYWPSSGHLNFLFKFRDRITRHFSDSPHIPDLSISWIHDLIWTFYQDFSHLKLILFTWNECWSIYKLLQTKNPLEYCHLHVSVVTAAPGYKWNISAGTGVQMQMKELKKFSLLELLMTARPQEICCITSRNTTEHKYSMVSVTNTLKRNL